MNKIDIAAKEAIVIAILILAFFSICFFLLLFVIRVFCLACWSPSWWKLSGSMTYFQALYGGRGKRLILILVEAVRFVGGKTVPARTLFFFILK